MSKAVIGTKVDGTSEILRNEVNGLLLAIDNLEDNLANAIVEDYQKIKH